MNPVDKFWINQNIKKQLTSLNARAQQEFSPTQHKENTRSHIAKIFVWGYFISLVVILLYVPFYNWFMAQVVKEKGASLNVKDVFIMVSGNLGSLLGFVLGHYFKGADNS